MFKGIRKYFIIILISLFIPIFSVYALDDENISEAINSKTINGKISDSFNVNDTFKIHLKINVPKEKNFTVKDKLPDGFKYNMDLEKDNLKVFNLNNEIIASDKKTEEGFILINNNKEEIGKIINNTKEMNITFNTEKLGEDIVIIEFSFKMDFQLDNNNHIISGPVIGNSGNLFSSLLTYNKSSTNETINISLNDVTLYTYGIQIINTDGVNILTGGEFTVYSDASATKEVGTVIIGEDGTGRINFLKEGTYYLKQTKPPANYQINSEITSINVGLVVSNGRKAMSRVATSNYSMATYANTVTLTMPYTGSSGTFIYVIVGTLFITLSIIFIIVYKKKQILN